MEHIDFLQHCRKIVPIKLEFLTTTVHKHSETNMKMRFTHYMYGIVWSIVRCHYIGQNVYAYGILTVKGVT